jgi:hypothetical protein
MLAVWRSLAAVVHPAMPSEHRRCLAQGKAVLSSEGKTPQGKGIRTAFLASQK